MGAEKVGAAQRIQRRDEGERQQREAAAKRDAFASRRLRAQAKALAERPGERVIRDPQGDQGQPEDGVGVPDGQYLRHRGFLTGDANNAGSMAGRAGGDSTAAYNDSIVGRAGQARWTGRPERRWTRLAKAGTMKEYSQSTWHPLVKTSKLGLETDVLGH